MMASLPSSMKALVKEREVATFEYRDVSVPVPRGDELLVRVTKVALCGSDINLYQWNHGRCARAACALLEPASSRVGR